MLQAAEEFPEHNPRRAHPCGRAERTKTTNNTGAFIWGVASVIHAGADRTFIKIPDPTRDWKNFHRHRADTHRSGPASRDLSPDFGARNEAHPYSDDYSA